MFWLRVKFWRKAKTLCNRRWRTLAAVFPSMAAEPERVSFTDGLLLMLWTAPPTGAKAP